MPLLIEIMAAGLIITAPASPVQEEYRASAFAMPGVELAWRGWDGWVEPRFCFDRCKTIPNQPNALLGGGISLQDAADLQLTVWRRAGDSWVQEMHCANFFTGPYCGPWR